jgi:hypothetical protein
VLAFNSEQRYNQSIERRKGYDMMKAGVYYIGDLCYVMHDCWDEFCDLTIKGNECLSGEFTMKDGRRFATYSTKYGDGLYPTNVGANLSVDAGLIGCILVSDIRDPEATEAAMKSLGTIVEFGTDFVTGGSRETGTIQFGRVVVETGDFYDDEEDEYDCE